MILTIFFFNLVFIYNYKLSIYIIFFNDNEEIYENYWNNI